VSRERLHRYAATLSWQGSTAEGYLKYARRHEVSAPPAVQSLTMSSDPAFMGDPRLLNPEQLLVLAASSCQLLSFLAIAARRRWDVRRYADQGEGFMPEDDLPVRVTRITLRPLIELAAGPSDDEVREAVQAAHHECYIASSLKTEILVEPTITFV
jgi:organic hydroperoxide reductase OsmC/OhrA